MQRWNPTKTNSQRCLRCRCHVTPEFRRTFGDGNDQAHRCLNCDIRPRITEGSAAGLDVEHTDPLDYPSRFGEQFDDLAPPVKALCREVATDGGEGR